MVLVPLVVGGKVYNSLKAVMTFKIIVVFGFLLVGRGVVFVGDNLGRNLQRLLQIRQRAGDVERCRLAAGRRKPLRRLVAGARRCPRSISR